MLINKCQPTYCFLSNLSTASKMCMVTDAQSHTTNLCNHHMHYAYSDGVKMFMVGGGKDSGVAMSEQSKILYKLLVVGHGQTN